MKFAVRFGGPVQDMLHAQNLAGDESIIYGTPTGEMGFLGCDVRESGGNVLAIAGTPINTPDYERIEDYRDAQRLLPEADGNFAILFWDARHRKLVFASDFLGTQPFYIRRSDGAFELASQTRAFRGKPNLSGWGASVLMGCTIGNGTLMEGVERVPPATVSTYDEATGTLQSREYWSGPEPAEPPSDDELLDSLRRSISSYARFAANSRIFLSGGGDSRLILYLLKDAGFDPRAIIVAHTGESFDADGRLARLVAKRSSTPFQYFCPSLTFFSSDDYVEYMAASDACVDSLYLFIAQLYLPLREAPGPFWEGMMPNFTIQLGTAEMPVKGGGARPAANFDDYVSAVVRPPDSPHWRGAAEIFTPDALDAMREGFRTDLGREIKRLPDDERGVLHFRMLSRMRHRLAHSPMKACGSYARALCPGLTREHVESSLLIPNERKVGRKLVDSLMRRFPSLPQLPYVNGGKVLLPRRRSATAIPLLGAEHLARLMSQHPRVFRLVGLTERRFARSTLLSPTILGQGSEDYLNDNVLMGKPLSNQATRLLFHWRTWERLHQGRLLRTVADLERALDR